MVQKGKKSEASQMIRPKFKSPKLCPQNEIQHFIPLSVTTDIRNNILSES